MPTDRDMFLTTFDMGSKKVNLLSIITLRYRKELTISIEMPLIKIEIAFEGNLSL